MWFLGLSLHPTFNMINLVKKNISTQTGYLFSVSFLFLLFTTEIFYRFCPFIDTHLFRNHGYLASPSGVDLSLHDPRWWLHAHIYFLSTQPDLWVPHRDYCIKCIWQLSDNRVIREKSHCTFLPLDSRNQESGADSWFLESNGKKVQWDFSLIID